MPKTPGKPLEVNEDEVINIEFKKCFRLSFVKSTFVEHRTIYFNEPPPMQMIINICKEYCSQKHYRFIFVEPWLIDLSDFHYNGGING